MKTPDVSTFVGDDFVSVSKSKEKKNMKFAEF